MKKGFGQIVIIAAATLLISAGLIFTFLQKNKTSEKPRSSPVPQYQTDETVYTEGTRSANWKIYENDTAKFSLKYPTEIILWNETSEPAGFVSSTFVSSSLKTTEIGECPPRTSGGSIQIYVNSFNFTKDKDRLTQLVEFEEKYFVNPKVQRSATMIDGQMAQNFTYLGPSDITTCSLAKGEVFKKILIINKYGTDFIIELRYFSQDKNLQKIFNQILSTFKFTDQNLDTTNWKTYTNSNLSFVLQHPSSWIAVACDVDDGVSIRLGMISDTCATDVTGTVNLFVSSSLASSIDDFKSSNSYITLEEKQINIDKVPGKKAIFEKTKNIPGPYRFMIIVEGQFKGKDYSFNADLTNQAVFNQILSTFKFVE